MPRTARGHQEGALLHLITRGVNRNAIFTSDLDKNCFLKWAREAFVLHDLSLMAYCLMPNHVHMLVAVGAIPLGRGMHDLLTKYAVYFNPLHDRVGHLFQNRFKEREVRDEKYLINVAAYIHLNAVRAGLSRSVDDWQWSGHRELLVGGGVNLDFSRLLELTGLSFQQFRAAYLQRLGELSKKPNLAGLALRDIIVKAALHVGLEPLVLFEHEKGEAVTKAKKLAIRWATDSGFSYAELARELKCSRAAITLLANEC